MTNEQIVYSGEYLEKFWWLALFMPLIFIVMWIIDRPGDNERDK